MPPNMIIPSFGGGGGIECAHLPSSESDRVLLQQGEAEDRCLERGPDECQHHRDPGHPRLEVPAMKCCRTMRGDEERKAFSPTIPIRKVKAITFSRSIPPGVRAKPHDAGPIEPDAAPGMDHPKAIIVRNLARFAPEGERIESTAWLDQTATYQKQDRHQKRRTSSGRCRKPSQRTNRSSGRWLATRGSTTSSVPKNSTVRCHSDGK